MRTLKLCTILGVLAALVVPAGAVTIPAIENGYVFWEMTNHDNGVSYASATPGTYTRAARGDAWTGPGTLLSAPAPGADPDEDTWGVFAVKTLTEGNPIMSGADIIGMDAAFNIYYEWTAGADTGLAGMFYGGWDSEVVVHADGSFDVRTEEVQMDLWAVDTSKLKLSMTDITPPTTNHEGPLFEVGRRDTPSTYEDWVDTGDATKIHLLHADSSYFRFSGEFVSPAGYFEGGTVIYWEVDDTLSPVWNKTWGTSGIFTDPDGVTGADLWTDVELVQDTKDWLAKSNDDGGTHVVPEPITMLGLLLGVGGVGGYIRRRRQG